MGKFVTTNVPAWRIVLWGVLAAGAVCGLSIFSSGHFNPRILFLAAFVGLLFPGFGFFLLWSARTGFTARHMRLLLAIYTIGQSVLLLSAILSGKR